MDKNQQKLKKLIDFKDDPSLVIFNEIQDLNSSIQEAISAIKNIPQAPEEISVSNFPSFPSFPEIPETNLVPLKDEIKKVVSSIEKIKNPDFGGIEKLLKEILNKEPDVKQFQAVHSVLDTIISAISNLKKDKIKFPEIPDNTKHLAAIHKLLDLINSNIVGLDVPEIDYEKLGDAVKGSITIATPAGGSSAISTASNAAITVVSSSITSVILLNINTLRKSALFFNDSTAKMYLKFGATASTASFTTVLLSQTYYEMPLPIFQGRIDGIWDAVNGGCKITELT